MTIQERSQPFRSPRIREVEKASSDSFWLAFRKDVCCIRNAERISGIPWAKPFSRTAWTSHNGSPATGPSPSRAAGTVSVKAREKQLPLVSKDDHSARRRPGACHLLGISEAYVRQRGRRHNAGHVCQERMPMRIATLPLPFSSTDRPWSIQPRARDGSVVVSIGRRSDTRRTFVASRARGCQRIDGCRRRAPRSLSATKVPPGARRTHRAGRVLAAKSLLCLIPRPCIIPSPRSAIVCRCVIFENQKV
jgi:hypothetical protein